MTLQQAASASAGFLRLLLISRPVLWINTVGVAVVGLWLGGQLWSWSLPWTLTLVWLTLPFNLLIYGLNDLSDGPEDALSPRKGGLQGARLRPGESRWIVAAIAALNAPLGFWLLVLAPAAAAWILLGALIFAAYSLPPLRLKSRPLLDSLSNAAYALPLLAALQLTGRAVPWPDLLGLICWAVAKHAFDAVQDRSADQKSGVRTVAVHLGVRGTVLWSAAWLLASILLLGSQSLWLGAGITLVSGGLLAWLWIHPDEPTAARLYLGSLLSPWILGTICGLPLVAHLVQRW